MYFIFGYCLSLLHLLYFFFFLTFELFCNFLFNSVKNPQFGLAFADNLGF